VVVDDAIVDGEIYPVLLVYLLLSWVGGVFDEPGLECDYAGGASVFDGEPKLCTAFSTIGVK
jgi:hypothetical protein